MSTRAVGERARLLGAHRTVETSVDADTARSLPRRQVQTVHVQDDGNIWSPHHNTISDCCSCSFSWPIASCCGCIVLVCFMLAPVPGTIPIGAVAITEHPHDNETTVECNKIFHSLNTILGPALIAFGSFYTLCWLPVLCIYYRIVKCQPHDCRDCYCRMHTAVILLLFCLSVIGLPVALVLTIREFVQESPAECLPVSVLLVAVSVIVLILAALQILSLVCLCRKRQQAPWDLAHNYQDGVYV